MYRIGLYQGNGVGVVTCFVVGFDVGFGVAHTPLYETFTPFCSAVHALLYVLPSAPHTGMYSCEHTPFVNGVEIGVAYGYGVA